MWVMIKKIIMVDVQYRPEFLGIYWAVPWIEASDIRDAFYREYAEDYGVNLWTGVKRRRKSTLQKDIDTAIPIEVFENIHDQKRYPDEYKEELIAFVNRDRLSSCFGLSPNPAGAVRVITNHEAVKIWPHEYSSVSTQMLKQYIEERSHSLVVSTVAEEKLETDLLEGDAKVLFEHAVMDGCSDLEARLMAQGVDVSERYEIPPTGWYQACPEIKAYFEGWETVGDPIGSKNHERRKKAAQLNQNRKVKL